jgi:hypothetical protein
VGFCQKGNRGKLDFVLYEKYLFFKNRISISKRGLAKKKKKSNKNEKGRRFFSLNAEVFFFFFGSRSLKVF